jgi:hypothetical protein
MHLAHVQSSVRCLKGGATCMGVRVMFAVEVCVFRERGTHLWVVTCVFKEHHDTISICSVEYSACQGRCNLNGRTGHVRSGSVCVRVDLI